MSVRQQAYNDFLAAISVTSGIAVWQEQLDWAFRILVSLVGIAAGCVAIYRQVKSLRKH